MSDIDNSAYADIIDMPRHVSLTRKHMSNYDRAAQFSPFAALTGYEDCIREAARLTDERGALDPDEIEKLDARLRQIDARIDERPEVIVTYFKPDELKDGGEYVTAPLKIKEIDRIEGRLVADGGVCVPIEDIYYIEELCQSKEKPYIR
ncbi:MAG: hypothetical protein IJR90_08320 [Clostridia bacterium]|nr:hypothetical protein [Clostridia bacterium]